MAKKPKSRTQQIDEILFELEKYFNVDLEETSIALYHKAWTPYTIEEIGAACSIWLSSYDDRRYDFMPRANQLIKIMEKAKGPVIPNIQARALDQWRVVLTHIKRHGAGRPATFEDPVTDYLIKNQFAWTYLAKMKEEDEKWEQKRWCEAFVLAVEVHDDLVRIEAPEKVLDLIGTVAKSVVDTNEPMEMISDVPLDKIKAYRKMLEAQANRDLKDLEKTNKRIGRAAEPAND